MTYFEWITSIISFLSLCATIFFGIQVYRLSRHANRIAKESLNEQKKANELKIDDIIKYVRKYYDNSETTKNIQLINREIKNNKLKIKK